MNDLSQVYDGLASNYKTELSEVEEKETFVLYCCKDYFSIEPFFFELNHIPEASVQFYNEDDLPCKNEVYQCLVHEGKVIFVRIYYGDDIYYDTFICKSPTLEVLKTVYVNSGNVKPIKVERLKRYESREYEYYEKYSEHGYEKFIYENVNNKTQINETRINKTQVKRHYYDTHKNLRFINELQVIYNSDLTEVDKILLREDGTEVSLYDASIVQEPLEKKIKKIQDIIVKVLVDSLQKHEAKTEEISFALFEYTMQGPFPPSVAFATSREVKESLAESEWGPLAVYNAPDLVYFSEEGFADIDFYCQGPALFDEVNKQLVDMDYEQATKIVENAYIDLCKRLKRNKAFKQTIQISPEFHVTARDFEACNEWQLLQKILPKKQLAKLQKKVEAYENQPVFNEQEQGIIDRVNHTLENPKHSFEELRNRLNNTEVTYVYAKELVFFLRPYEYEKEIGSLKPGNLKSICEESQGEGLPFTYGIDKHNRVVYVCEHEEQKISWQTFYDYEGDNIESFHFEEGENGQDMTTYECLINQGGNPVKYTSKSLNSYHHIEYMHSNACVVSKDYDCFFITKTMIQRYIHQKVDYKDNEIYKISHYVTLEDEQLDFNRVSMTVDYCRDNSYIDEALEDAVQACCEDIMLTLDKNVLKDCVALVIEKTRGLLFPLMNISLVKSEQGELNWQKHSVYNFDEKNDKLYLNATVYCSGSNLSSDEVYESLGKNVVKEIKNKFAIDLGYFIKEEFESGNSIETALLT